MGSTKKLSPSLFIFYILFAFSNISLLYSQNNQKSKIDKYDAIKLIDIAGKHENVISKNRETIIYIEGKRLLLTKHISIE